MEPESRQAKGQDHFQHHGLFVLMVIVSIGMVLSPLFHSGLYLSTDAPFHLARIESLYLALREGVFPVKVHFVEAYTYGYGVGFFYPDCFLYFPAVLMLLGTSLELAYKISASLVIFGAWGGMFYAVNHLLEGRNRRIGAVGASMYIMSAQFLGYLYGSQSLGSATAMAFLPVCLSELLFILFRKYRKKDLISLTLAAAGILLSHVSTAILTMLFMILLVALNSGRILQNPRRIRDLFLCAAGGALLTSGFWLPALEQVMDQKFVFQTGLIHPISENTVSFWNAVETLGFEMLSVLILTIVLFVWIILLQPEKSDRQIIGSGLAAELIFTGLVFCPSFWKTFGIYLEFVQFPDRLLSQVVAMAVLILCLEFALPQMRGKRTVGYIGIVIFLIALLGAGKIFSEYGSPESLGEGLLTEKIAGLGAGEEWLPDGAGRWEMTEPEKSYDPYGGGADGVKHAYGKYYEVYVPLKYAYYDVPYLYYKGYEAYLLNENGEPTEKLTVEKSDRGGCVRVLLPQRNGEIGHIMVIYRKTAIQKEAYFINALSVLALAAILIGHRFCQKKT